jgi:hypothetical protein
MGSVDGFLIGFLWVGHVLLMFIYSGQVRTSAPHGSLPGTVILLPLGQVKIGATVVPIPTGLKSLSLIIAMGQ